MTDPISRAAAPATRARIAPILPLTLLQMVRRRDLPEEVLEGEDLPASLPRRLGLSDVVARQIARYDDAVRRSERISVQEVHDLLRLVLRRPDGRDLLSDTGRALARRHFERVSGATRATLRVLPRALVWVVALRSARRFLRPLTGGSRLESRARPPLVRVRPSITAAADEAGAACVLFSGALEELASLYRRTPVRATHSACEALGAPSCEWTLADAE